MREIRVVAIVAIVAMIVSACPVAAGEHPLRVTASFPVLADIVAQVGGSGVAVTSLVAVETDPHSWQPRPRDVQRLADAELLVVNGLGYEGWLDRLVGSSGYAGPVVEVSEGIVALRGHTGMEDPHAWHGIEGARHYAAAVAEALSRLRPASAAVFRENLAAFEAALDGLADWAEAAIAEIPPERRVVVTTHDAFAYLGREFGIRFLSPVGLDSAAQPSARRVAEVVRQIRLAGVRAVFPESGADSRLAQVLAEEAGVAVGGRLYAGNLSAADGPAPNFLAMWRHNFRLMSEAMTR